MLPSPGPSRFARSTTPKLTANSATRRCIRPRCMGSVPRCRVPWVLDDRRRAVGNGSGTDVHFLVIVHIEYQRVQLIEHTLTTHPAYNELVRRAEDAGKDVHAGSESLFILLSISFDSSRPVLQDVLEEMRINAGLRNFTELTRHIHVYPDFRGAFGCNTDLRWKLRKLTVVRRESVSTL